MTHTSNLLMRCVAAVALFVAALVAAGFTQNFTITVTISVPVFTCSGFAASGVCGTSFIGGGGQPFAVVGTSAGTTPGLSGTAVELMVPNANHAALNMNYTTAVNVQTFSTTFTFVPDGWNIAFVLSNNTNTASAQNAAGGNFSAGAGCEGSFFQGFPGVPNNTFALELDQASNLSGADQSGPGGGVGSSGAGFYSSAQYYSTGANAANAPNPPGQSPCTPDLSGGSNFTYHGVDKVSTSPVPLNNPATTVLTTTGDTYSVTITYDGSNLTVSLFDVTASGSCPGASCFTKTWNGVNIPAIVGGNTAWVGLAGGTNNPLPNALLINSWSYSN
jgi:hypothetical protein